MSRSANSLVNKVRHKKVLKRAKGFYGARSKNYKTAKQAVMKAMSYSTRDRKQRQRLMRQIWIMRLNAAARENGLNYSSFLSMIKASNVGLDRKMISELAIAEPGAFKDLVAFVSKS